ncbi:UDP-N-acetylglucosamine transferase subunit ALG13 [Desulfacinum hydrothermale DSM 13146]|uniref:UDP-N-acetylglucosamine transferase subunit ALG13 n=1 Tax=Desulfacinum hydrothermale DSM 13146 TaxID=1121390 RepID=A0A1W1XQY5_9BACT|nr:PssE/Cps14G family polysaccharide biosynthesis glycosyltransferase [Desulfacinum hydrothermale]SMC26272.1 UDP-N-acetylglucosamine transferase subunit ALG13 [Desulfacinum hydrothermale DSM 13146]
MIFVTVGTTLPFDDLIRQVDRLVERGEIHEPVVCQIGTGSYRPRHCQYFDFQPTLDPWYQEASVVVAHGGTGTVLELLGLQKPFVAVANPRAVDDHQVQFLRKLESVGSVLWCRDLEKLPAYLLEAPGHRAQGLPYCSLARHLMERLEDNRNGRAAKGPGSFHVERFPSGKTERKSA